MNRTRVYWSAGLVGKNEWADLYVEGGTLRQMVNAYLKAIALTATET